MFQEFSLASLRHGMTSAGPLIIAYSPVTGTEWEAFIGGVITVVGFGLSLARKVQNKPRAA